MSTSTGPGDAAGRPVLEVGRIGRAHGLGGEVSVRLITERLERVAPGSILFAVRPGATGGTADSLELTVVGSRPHQDRWLVRFDGYEDRTAAEALWGLVLRAEAIHDPEALFVHELVACRVVDADGVDRGVVEAVQANPASDLLVLDSGALIPLTFVVGGVEHVEGGGRVVRVDTPDGLFELYE
ncbi:MAG: ribosome maturation factor RimM [Microthrixaceae bacterium]